MHPEETVCNRVRDPLARKSSPASRCRGTLEPLEQRNGENGEPRRPTVAEPVQEEMLGEQRQHKWDCEWHCEQYPWECTCGLTVPNGKR